MNCRWQLADVLVVTTRIGSITAWELFVEENQCPDLTEKQEIVTCQ